MAKKIEIGVGNTSTERLALSDGGYTEADKGENIKWVIGEDSNVSSFRIELKTMPREIFSKRPYKDGTKWKARIKSDAFYDDECKYTIFWTHNGNEYEDDPKISVKPTTFSLLAWLITFLLGLFGIAYLIYRRKKRMNSQAEKR